MNKLPPIPEKKYFSISEVASLCELKAHTLRFWENEFKELKPLTRKGNRRCYKKEDIALILQIKTLLYEERLTISGAKKKFLNKEEKQENKVSADLIIELEDILRTLKNS